jgi:hypothetical protein
VFQQKIISMRNGAAVSLRCVSFRFCFRTYLPALAVRVALREAWHSEVPLLKLELQAEIASVLPLVALMVRANRKTTVKAVAPSLCRVYPEPV